MSVMALPNVAAQVAFATVFVRSLESAQLVHWSINRSMRLLISVAKSSDAGVVVWLRLPMNWL